MLIICSRFITTLWITFDTAELVLGTALSPSLSTPPIARSLCKDTFGQYRLYLCQCRMSWMRSYDCCPSTQMYSGIKRLRRFIHVDWIGWEGNFNRNERVAWSYCSAVVTISFAFLLLSWKELLWWIAEARASSISMSCHYFPSARWQSHVSMREWIMRDPNLMLRLTCASWNMSYILKDKH